MRGETVSILEGNTFVVSDRRGDIDASPSEPTGLFHRDTRHLSRWRLTLDGRPLTALSTDDLHYFAAQFFLVPGTGTVYTDATLSLIRTRAVGDGFHEELAVLNHGREPAELTLRLEAAADFADLFEVKDALAKRGQHYARVEAGRLVLGYRRERFVRETWIAADAPEATLDEGGLTFAIRVAPHGEWATGIEVVAARDGGAEPKRATKYRAGEERARPNLEVGLEEALAAAPQLATDWAPLERTYRRSLVDLAALRFYPLILPGRALPAAGLPWFMAVFGRDSLLTSLQALPFTPGLAEATLRALAARQGTRVDDFREEEPGKILHELRFGELTAFEERPHSPYYGAADATPLFLVLLDEYERWTGDARLARELEGAGRAALAWIDAYGDRDGDGYVEYERRNAATGLENQCWKDSWNAILFADGALASLPRATCEIQGYVYDAKRRGARLARQVWRDPGLARRLEHDAAALKRRFNRDFWLAERGYYALALDGEKRPVDALTSNIGHLLWSGIADEEKAARVAAHLLGPRLYSGWGVRTMAEGDGGYNPLAYHNGTVWPHDNALVALGLRRYGHGAAAARVAFGLLEAAAYFDHRLPEAFAGYPRARTRFPVEYPTACRPQAWAAGAPLLLLRALLGLEPDGAALRVDPALPDQIARLELRDIPWRGGRIDASSARPTGAGGAPAPAEASAAGPMGAGRVAAPAAPAGAPPAAGSARAFFAGLGARLGGAAWGPGACRFDVAGAGSWRVASAGGRVSVSESADPADAVIALPEDLLLQIARGEQHPMTAFLSGRVEVRGDLALADRVVRALF